MPTATYLHNREGGTGEMRLYKLDPPLEGQEYVVVSVTVAPYSGPETYIFPANSEGEITDWCEMEGSFRGALDHKAALQNAGYKVQNGA